MSGTADSRPVEAVIELRPRRPGELLDVSVRLTRVIFRSVAPWIVLVEAPFALIAYGWIASLGSDRAEAVGQAFGVLSLLAVPAIVFASAIAIGAATDAHLGQRPNGSRSALLALRRLPALLVYCVVGAVVYLGIAMGAIFAVSIPIGLVGRVVTSVDGVLRVVLSVVLVIGAGVAWNVVLLGQFSRFLVGMVSLLVERRGPFKAFKRGWALTRRQWASNGMLLLLTAVLSYVLLIVAIVLGGWLGSTTGRGAGAAAITGSLFFMLFGLIAFPFYASVGVSMHVDGRVRREALDIEQLITRLPAVPV